MPESKEEFIARKVRQGWLYVKAEERWDHCVDQGKKLLRQQQLQTERIAEFAQLGIKAQKGFGAAGSITFGATEAAKLLRLIRKAQKRG